MRLFSRWSLGTALLALVVSAAFVAAPNRAREADAFETWCFDDPLVMVDGQLVDIQVQLPLLSLLAMRKTTLTVIIPSNTKGYVLVDDVSAFPMKTTVSATGPAWNGKGGVPITIVSNVQASTSFAIRLQATPLLNRGTPLAAPVRLEGKTNADLRLPMTLGR